MTFRIRPQVVITAGSFIGVPIIWAAFLLSFLRKQESRIIVHQQDIRPGIANKLCARFADKITVTFETSLNDYPHGKAEWLGNPVREWIGQGSRSEAQRLWPLGANYPTVLIMGGSSGAQAINEWVWSNLPQLTKFANIIHLTGVGKSKEEAPSPFKGEGRVRVGETRYTQLEFLDKDLAHALAAADLVVSRAGIATLSELSYLGKAAVLVPLAGTHQEENADYFASHGAAVVFKQNKLDEQVVDKIKSLLADDDKRAVLSKNIKKIMKVGAREKLVDIVSSVIASPPDGHREARQSNNRDGVGIASLRSPRAIFARNDSGKIHLIGIGGINVSAIAKLLLSESKAVSGSDLVASDITTELEEKGARVVIGHTKENIAPGSDLVIYSDAVPADNPERQAANERNIPQMSNFQFWGEYAADKKVIAVSGTNGKSTTTAMLGLILEAAGFDPTVVVGTKVLQWENNIRIGQSDWLVIEADEYRAHMLEFKPHVAVITNITPDHLDFYKNLDDIVAHFQKWVEMIPPDGGLVLNGNDPASQKLRLGKIKVVIPAAFSPDVHREGIQKKFHLQVPGAFNVANALAAAAAAQLLGVSDDIIVSSLNNFTGTWRRFEKVGEYKGALVISDYAHHPDGIKVTLQAAREKYPNRRLVVLYQPHQHNRTRKLFDQFVESFDIADELILAEIYDVAGREETQNKSVSSKDLVEAIIARHPERRSPQATEVEGSHGLTTSNITYAPDLQSAEEMVKNLIKPNDVLIVMGAGDVDKVARNLCQP